MITEDQTRYLQECCPWINVQPANNWVTNRWEDEVAEMVLHELCHASVFGIREVEARRLSEKVHSCFLMYVDHRASDRSEFRAVAVEIIVLDMLKIEFKFEELLINVLEGTKWYTSYSCVKDYIHRYALEPIAHERAAGVYKTFLEFLRTAPSPTTASLYVAGKHVVTFQALLTPANPRHIVRSSRGTSEEQPMK